IPPKYRNQKKRFLQILGATYIVQTEETTKQRASDFVRKLAVEPDKDLTEITIEAIGNQCLSKLAALLELSDPHIRLRAARCMLNLGSDQGLNTLRQIAIDKNSPYRIEAIETISASASRNDASALARLLLKDEDFNIVKVAYERLRKLNDIAITQKLIGRNFYLEQIPIIKQKYIMVYRSSQPRVVIFGAPIYCKENLFIESEDGNIVLNAPAGQKYISIIRKHPKRPNVLIKLKSSFELGDIITTLCEESIKKTPKNQTGLNISYEETISLLKQMVDKGAIKDENVQFKAGPMPEIEQISRNY
ncbi:MAG: HEAT repeat domain-containing protein, partial [Planctomycetes bacterium]|nr:HEAT repeat domain-containing protein [Planctomycetota bacterium]